MSAAPGTAAASQKAPQQASSIAPAPAPAAPSIDAQVSRQLEELKTGRYDRLLGGRRERMAIAAFYSGRSYAPLWITDGHANARAQAAIAYFAHVGADGLDPADYPVPDFNKLTDPAALARAELQFSMSVLRYAHHAWLGRVAWSRVSASIWYERKALEPASVLAAVADAKNVAAALDSYEPHTPGYLALKKKLAQIRAGKGYATTTPIPHGKVLWIGSHDKRVPALRARLGVSGTGTTYGRKLAKAVKKFQRAHHLRQTGKLTAATLNAINGRRPTHAVDTIIANMERWRWMAHRLPDTYVMINLPNFTAAVYHDGKRIWKTEIVIGKTDLPTPITTAMMRSITVNPIWHVPPSIINKEYLPAMAQDPTVMKRMGLVVERGPDGRVTGIYQPPGPGNAEGRIRFNFPNRFMVFQHDTPDKWMFGHAVRAYSHGCMRTQYPAHYAAVLLSLERPGQGFTVARIKSMYGPQPINISLPKPLPIFITYQTAFVNSAGRLEFRADIYGRDRQLLDLLNGPDRRVADIPVARPISAVHTRILAGPDNPAVYGSPASGLASFFSKLFGGGSSESQPAAYQNTRARRRWMARASGH